MVAYLLSFFILLDSSLLFLDKFRQSYIYFMFLPKSIGGGEGLIFISFISAFIFVIYFLLWTFNLIFSSFFLVSWDVKLGCLKSFLFLNVDTYYYKLTSQKCLCYIQEILVCYYSIFYIIFLFLLWSMMFNLHIYVSFPGFLFFL